MPFDAIGEGLNWYGATVIDPADEAVPFGVVTVTAPDVLAAAAGLMAVSSLGEITLTFVPAPLGNWTLVLPRTKSDPATSTSVPPDFDTIAGLKLLIAGAASVTRPSVVRQSQGSTLLAP